MPDGLFDLSGRTAVVAGGTSGIGRTLALGLADAGADFVVVGRRQALVNDAAAAIESRGRRTLRMTADVTDRTSLERVREACVQSFGHVDILVAASAISTSTSAYRRGWPVARTAAASHASSAVRASSRSSHHATGWNQNTQRLTCASHDTSGSRRSTCACSWARTAAVLSAGQAAQSEGSRILGRKTPVVRSTATVSAESTGTFTPCVGDPCRIRVSGGSSIR